MNETFTGKRTRPLATLSNCQAVNDSLTSDADGTSHTYCRVAVRSFVRSAVRLLSGAVKLSSTVRLKLSGTVRHCQALSALAVKA
eukprot:5659339-Prymnesium_polylepis.1